MRAAIYARVSTRDKGQDTANQLAQLREFAASQKWTIAVEYIEHESAGGQKARAEYRRMFADAAQRRFDVVLFWALDRLSRSGAFETLQDLNRLAGYRVQFRSFTEPYLDSCGTFGEAVIAILATIAKQERIRLSERTRAGLDQARRDGIRLGRPPADRQRALDMKANGSTPAAIADKLGISRTTVWKITKSPTS